MTTFATSVGGLDDAALARAAAAGDRAAFAAIYDRYADRLHDFCVGMLRDRDAAADCVQDVFVTAATKLVQLREPDRLRSWLYAIARSEALARIRDRKREMPSEELPDMPTAEADLPTMAARSELADLIAECCGGLTDRDRLVYELAYRQSLDGPELAEALGVTHKNANTLVERLRDTIARSLGALLVCRRTKADPDKCPELAEVLSGWDGQFTVLMRKRVARHIDGCAVCEQDRAQMVSPAALLGAAPVVIPAPAWLRARTLEHAVAPTPTPGAGSGESWWPDADLDISDLAGPPSGGGGPAAAARPKPRARAGLGVGLVALGIGAALVLSRPAALRVDPANDPKPLTSTSLTTTTPSAIPRMAPPPPPSEEPSTVPPPVVTTTPETVAPTPEEPATTTPPPPRTHDREPTTTEQPTTTQSRPKPKPQQPDVPDSGDEAPPVNNPPPDEPSNPDGGTPGPVKPPKPPPVKPPGPKQPPVKEDPQCPASNPDCNSGPVFT